MIKVARNRDTGKTKELLKECANVNGIYLCKHPTSIPEKCATYNIPLVEAYGYNYLFDSETRPIFIDDIDAFMNYRYSNVKGISLSID